ncbi:cytokine receptor [Caerostris extrusa]|uniref:Cytokine receptor n=1 Tax=Caerostris extrusa TaxID=172846 RepID=A0AAV4RN63_CAEEX|nr:cytokine receptor [Caerostris extrusa]
MVPPRVEYANETHFQVLWTSPSTPNGPISFYELLWHQEMGNETTNLTISINEGLSTYIDFECPNLLKGGINYLLYVRAVNERNGTFLYGPFSDSAKATACIMSQGTCNNF